MAMEPIGPTAEEAAANLANLGELDLEELDELVILLLIIEIYFPNLARGGIGGRIAAAILRGEGI